MTPTVLPQLVANNGAYALRAAIADPDRFACEPKVDGVRGLVVFDNIGVEFLLNIPEYEAMLAELAARKAKRQADAELQTD